MTEQRRQRILKTAMNRQVDLTVVLENVHDPHNIGAVIRTCESVGIPEIFVIHTEERLQTEGIRIGKNASSGANKWVKVNYYTNLEQCYQILKDKYKTLISTFIGHTDSKPHFDLNFNISTAILFGNEHLGLSRELTNLADFHMFIPQFGMVKSLNISVACAIVLYEICRQREAAGCYRSSQLSPIQNVYYQAYIEKSKKQPNQQLK